MSKLTDARDRIEELEEELAAGVTAIEAHCSHIVMTWIEYSGGRVGLDAAGSMVRVELEPALYGWAVER